MVSLSTHTHLSHIQLPVVALKPQHHSQGPPNSKRNITVDAGYQLLLYPIQIYQNKGSGLQEGARFIVHKTNEITFPWYCWRINRCQRL